MTCGLFTEYTKTSRLRRCRARIDVTGTIGPSVCPSTCALEVEICAEVERYAKRIHHPDRLTRPLLRTGPKGSGQFREMGWNEALDRVAPEEHHPRRDGGVRSRSYLPNLAHYSRADRLGKCAG